jgi:hypothetical protein
MPRARRRVPMSSPRVANPRGRTCRRGVGDRHRARGARRQPCDVRARVPTKVPRRDRSDRRGQVRDIAPGPLSRSSGSPALSCHSAPAHCANTPFRARHGRRCLAPATRRRSGQPGARHPSWTEATPVVRSHLPLDAYGFSEQFCWIADRFGVTSPLNLAGRLRPGLPAQRRHPLRC